MFKKKSQAEIVQQDLPTTRLMQRLTKPSPRPSPEALPRQGLAALGGNPFSFGGGLVNGGLSKEAMDQVSALFDFDYMGAAEYEFGALPEALKEVAHAAEIDGLVAQTISIPWSQIAKTWDEEGIRPTGQAEVFTICRKEHTEALDMRVRQWAKGQMQNGVKQGVWLNRYLLQHSTREGKVVGWLEENNGLFVFLDRDVWVKTAEFFGVTIPEPEKESQ